MTLERTPIRPLDGGAGFRGEDFPDRPAFHFLSREPDGRQTDAVGDHMAQIVVEQNDRPVGEVVGQSG